MRREDTQRNQKKQEEKSRAKKRRQELSLGYISHNLAEEEAPSLQSHDAVFRDELI